MYFISENSFTFIETVFSLLTEPFTLLAGAFVLIVTTLFTALHMDTKPDPSLSKIWSVSLTLGFVSSILTSLIFALAIASLIGHLDKGYYETTGTIEKIEYHSKYAGHTDGNFTISLKLDNGDPVDIQIPLQSPESIKPGDTFTLQSEPRYKGKDFIPIEKLYYSPEHQSLSSGQFPDPQITIHFIVEGDVIKGDSD